MNYYSLLRQDLPLEKYPEYTMGHGRNYANESGTPFQKLHGDWVPLGVNYTGKPFEQYPIKVFYELVNKRSTSEFPIAQSDSGEFAVEPEFKDHRQKSLEALSRACKEKPEVVKSAIKKYFGSKPKVSLWRRVVQWFLNLMDNRS